MSEAIEVVDTRPDRSKEYGEFECLLDRILVRRIISDNASGFAVGEKFRQHSNWGTVEAIGDSVVLGGVRFPLSGFIQVGDLVKYAEHTAEQFDINDPDLFIIRVQDCRGRRRVKA
jgi:co-chaperonin GroES (HSP10)